MDVVVTGSGPVTVVAVHGIQGTRAAWSALARELDGEARFVLPNLRGRGQAARGAGVEDYRLERLADDLEDVVRAHVADGCFVLAGWSMGVSVSLEYLSRAGVPRPQGLVLMSGTPMLDRAQWFRERGDALIDEIAEREVRLGLVEAADRDAAAWTWEAIRDTNQTRLLAAIDMPTLIVHGRDDADSPWSHAERLAAGLPDARLCALPGVGHAVLKDAGADVARELRAFLQELDSTGKP
jgi:pimeloyl-ACP methyl ester carboxylesterase